VFRNAFSVGHASPFWELTATCGTELNIVGGFRLGCFTSLGSVATLYWVLLLHCIGFCWNMEELGSLGSGRIDQLHLYMYRGAERSWFFILYTILLARQNQPIIG